MICENIVMESVGTGPANLWGQAPRNPCKTAICALRSEKVVPHSLTELASILYTSHRCEQICSVR